MYENASMSELLKQAGLLRIGSIDDAESLTEDLTYQEASRFMGAGDSRIFMLAHDMRSPIPPHTHDFYEISYVMDGTVINKVEGKRLYMVNGSLCIMNLKSFHELEAVNTNAVLVTIGLRRELFDEGVFHEFLMDGNDLSKFLRGETQNEYLFYTESKNGALGSAIIDMVREYADAGFKQSFGLAGQVLQLLDTLSKTPSRSLYDIDRRALEMMEYIRENCATVTVGSLAREFGYSENYCSQYVKRHTGRTITELIADARFERAEELLKTTDLSVEAIARSVGYRSSSHFHERFKERHGMTPADYRILGREATNLE